MVSKDKEDLLARYWQGETSLEEEAQLRAWLSSPEGSEAPRGTRAWFDYLAEERRQTLNPACTRRLLQQIQPPVVKARRLSLRMRFLPLCKAAAAVALIVALGHGLQDPLDSPGPSAATVDTIGTLGFGQQAPSVALSGKKAAVREKQLLDSLQRKKE